MGLVELEAVSRTYQMGGHEIFALFGISLELDPGELTVVLGPSGSGKTTLLNVIGGIDRPTSGRISFGDISITELSNKDLGKFRRSNCGFVFQFFNLLPIFNALENVSYAVELADQIKSRKQVEQRAFEYLKAVGMEEKAYYFPSQMSGGEQQRVAAARAFAKEPQILLCDEPTGELSVKEGRKVLSVIQQMVTQKQREILVLLVTHNQKIAQIGHRVVRLRSGEVNSVETQKPIDANQISW
ncbi:MAG: ABC transporter ATP-binding protein [Candidatus Thorarchaeota archaeon]